MTDRPDLIRAVRDEVLAAIQELRAETHTEIGDLRREVRQYTGEVTDAFPAAYESGCRDTRERVGVGEPAQQFNPPSGWRRRGRFWVSPAAAFIAWLVVSAERVRDQGMVAVAKGAGVAATAAVLLIVGGQPAEDGPNMALPSVTPTVRESPSAATSTSGPGSTASTPRRSPTPSGGSATSTSQRPPPPVPGEVPEPTSEIEPEPDGDADSSEPPVTDEPDPTDPPSTPSPTSTRKCLVEVSAGNIIDVCVLGERRRPPDARADGDQRLATGRTSIVE